MQKCLFAFTNIICDIKHLLIELSKFEGKCFIWFRHVFAYECKLSH